MKTTLNIIFKHKMLVILFILLLGCTLTTSAYVHEKSVNEKLTKQPVDTTTAVSNTPQQQETTKDPVSTNVNTPEPESTQPTTVAPTKQIQQSTNKVDCGSLAGNLQPILNQQADSLYQLYIIDKNNILNNPNMNPELQNANIDSFYQNYKAKIDLTKLKFNADMSDAGCLRTLSVSYQPM